MGLKEIHNFLLTPGDTLSRRVVHGGVWSLSLRAFNRLFAFARTIVLARLLAPEDFGLFGVAMVALSALERFSITGFNEALVQKKDDIRPYLNSAWAIQIIRGLVVALILALAAPLVGLFFDEPNAVMLLRILAIAVFIAGFKNIGIVFLRKDLEFHKEFAYEFSATLFDFGVAISAAIILRNAWALVFGYLARSIAYFVVSYFIHPYRPRFELDKARWKELFSFGRWILGSSILVFLITEGDDIFVGKILGMASLGFYQLAYSISNLPATEITHVISKVTFPAYSKLQDDIAKLKNAYLKVIQANSLLSFPIAGFILVLGGNFTSIFLGDKWLPMVPAMQALVIWGLNRSIGACTGPLFQAAGKPKLATIMQAVRLAMIIVIIYPLTVRFDILGAALTITITGLITRPITDYLVLRLIKARAWDYLKQLLPPLCCTILSCGIVVLFKAMVLEVAGVLSFLVVSVFAVALYAVCIYIISKIFDYNPLRNIMLSLKKD